MDLIQIQRPTDELSTTPCGLSIGSPSQRLFESESDNESDNIRRYGTCNGYTSQPGSKSNLLLCIQCDLESRSCHYRPRTPNQFSRFIEEDRAMRCEQCYLDNNLPLDDCHCTNCDLTTQNEPDLICFRCENDSEDRTTEEEGLALCSKCEEPSTTEDSPGQTNGSVSGQGTSSSNSETGHYPVDAVVKIHVNDKLLLDGDSDDTCDDSSVPSREVDELITDRLSPIVEQEVQSENADDSAGSNNDGKMNGLRSRYLDGMLVLFM